MARGNPALVPYPPEKRAEALELACEFGPREAGRRTGINENTIAAWQRRLYPETPIAAVDRAIALTVAKLTTRDADRPTVLRQLDGLLTARDLL